MCFNKDMSNQNTWYHRLQLNVYLIGQTSEGHFVKEVHLNRLKCH